MKKIPSVFLRDPNDMNHLLTEPHPFALWVLAGEGVPTRKFDGTCTMFDGTDWFARREVKSDKTAPVNWVECETDGFTGKRVGWEPMAQSPWHKLHVEAMAQSAIWEPGTYELLGPKINGNPENVSDHRLVRHGREQVVPPLDYSYNGLCAYVLGFGKLGWEGIVWHHPDGRMAKLKAKDFSS